jgi:hypothetical protein
MTKTQEYILNTNQQLREWIDAMRNHINVIESHLDETTMRDEAWRDDAMKGRLECLASRCESMKVLLDTRRTFIKSDEREESRMAQRIIMGE